MWATLENWTVSPPSKLFSFGALPTVPASQDPMVMSRRALMGWSCASVYVGIFGRDSSPDPDLSALRSDYMATWKPDHLDGEMRFGHPSNRGPKSLETTASLERRLGFVTTDLASAARVEAFAAADENGWSRGAGDSPLDAPRLKRIVGGVWAGLAVSLVPTAPSQILLRIEIR